MVLGQNVRREDTVDEVIVQLPFAGHFVVKVQFANAWPLVAGCKHEATRQLLQLQDMVVRAKRSGRSNDFRDAHATSFGVLFIFVHRGSVSKWYNGATYEGET